MEAISRALGFFSPTGITHYINLLFIFFLIRSGIEILSAHPKLYFDEASRPGKEWLRFTRKRMPKDRLWTGADEEESFSPWIALPGRNNLGLGRHWHFFSIVFWVLNGLAYVVLLFATGGWRRLIPTSWEIFPAAARSLWTYLHLQLPPPGSPYNPLQQLAYAAIVFLVAPFLIATGAAMSPALGAHFPGYVRLFRGHQTARSLHFLGLVTVLVFTVIHVALVAIEDFPRNMAFIIHGQRTSQRAAVVIGLAGLAVAAALHVIATHESLRHPRKVKHALGKVIEPVRQSLLHPLTSRQHYPPSAITPFFRVNGYPPTSPEYVRQQQADFREWLLDVHGLVEKPLRLSLDDLRALPSSRQITKHRCIQGWSGVAEWRGVPVSVLLELCRPLSNARFLIFHAWDEPRGRPFYESIDLRLAHAPQTLLAYEMNGQPLPVPHGAPCRLRVETQLGFKSVKYLRAIELAEDYRRFGEGEGGWREDVQNYGPEAGI